VKHDHAFSIRCAAWKALDSIGECAEIPRKKTVILEILTVLIKGIGHILYILFQLLKLLAELISTITY